MQLEFGYGNGVQTVELPQENLLSVLHAAPIGHGDSPKYSWASCTYWRVRSSSTSAGSRSPRDCSASFR